VIGYKGVLQLAIRSGYYKKLNVLAIKEGELIRFDPINEEIEVRLIEDDEAREQAETIGYYAMFEYTNGFRKCIYWSKKKMEAHALKYSQGYRAKKGFTFWERDFDAMAYKTMIKQLITKWGIMSIDMQTAMASDNAAIKADMTPEYVDNTPDNAPDYMAKPEAPEIEEKPAEKVKKPAKEKAIKTEPEPVAAADDAQADNEAMRALFG
jgi:recombination protein RecT